MGVLFSGFLLNEFIMVYSGFLRLFGFVVLPVLALFWVPWACLPSLPPCIAFD